jgi:hypothetical protein
MQQDLSIRNLEDELVETGTGAWEVLVIPKHEANAGASARSWTERPSWSFRDAATICARERVIGGQESLAHV